MALDAAGNVAAATSTGGTHIRLAGRVGDTPIIGAGTYADNAVGALSGTGEGEYFLRAVLAHDIAARVEHGGKSLAEAAEAAMREKVTARGGFGGIIGVDRRGNPVMVFNTPTMARGAISGADGERAWRCSQTGCDRLRSMHAKTLRCVLFFLGLTVLSSGLLGADSALPAIPSRVGRSSRPATCLCVWSQGCANL